MLKDGKRSLLSEKSDSRSIFDFTTDLWEHVGKKEESKRQSN